MRILIACMLVAVALSGCSDGSSSEPTDQTDSDKDLKATDTTGVIRGVVVNNAIEPIPDAQVRIAAEGLEATSLADGSFGFSDLEPGLYTLEVFKDGFSLERTTATVEAGIDLPPIVTVRLTEQVGAIPMAVPYTFEGYIECGWVVVVASHATCSETERVGVDLNDEFITFIEVPELPTFTQTEAIWDATQTAGDSLMLAVYEGTLYAPRDDVGASPLTIKADRAFWENGTGSATGDGPAMLNDPPRISFRVFAGGLDGTREAGTWGVGVTLSQQFNMYSTLFYNMVPEESWSFATDGAYEV